MKKTLNRLLQILLGILTVFFFVIITVLIISLSKQFQTMSFDNYQLYIGAILSLIFVFFFKKNRTYFFSTITFVILFVTLNFSMNNFGAKDLDFDYLTIWNNTEHCTTIPFYSSKSGHIYLKVKIGNETKYILFDTGAEICGFNEKYNVASKKNDTIFLCSITDSQGKKNEMRIHRLKNLSIGDLNFKKSRHIAMSNDIWKKECGIFFNQDSIAGVLGNNIINSFVWDFDMLNRTLKISEKTELQNISTTDIIPLFKIGKKSWSIKIKVNEKQKSVTLDSGSDGNLVIKDSITLRKNYNYKIVQHKSKGLFSYKDCDKKNDSAEITTEIQTGKRKIFADLTISNTTFKDVLIEDSSNSNVNLLGVPLFWEYERVVLDFLNGKMYLFNKNYSEHTQSITNISNKWRKDLIKKPVPNKVYKK